MRTVTTEDNPYKVAGDILFASSEVESDFRSVDLYGSSVRRKKEDAICSRFHLENESGTGDIAVYQTFPGMELVYNDMHLSNGEELLYTVRKKKQIVAEIQEKQKRMINALGKRGIPATEEEYRRYYSSFEYLPIAFTDIEMVFNEESHAVDWIFRYANQELARLEKLSLNQLLGKSFGSLFSNMDSKWLRSYERSALYGEVLELMDYSPEIDTNLKVICFPTFKGHCGCILFDLDRIKAVDSSNNVHKIWGTYLRNRTK